MKVPIDTHACLDLDAPTLPAVIPEPSTLAIWALGLLGLGLYGWRRKR